MAVVDVHSGTSPLILGFPHVGTQVPPEIWDRLNDNGKILADTDWHFQTTQEMLFPCQLVLTSIPVISGKALSAAFLDRGERGLFWVVSDGSSSMYPA